MCLCRLIKSHWILQSTTKPAAFSKGKTLIDPQNYASPSWIVSGTLEAGKPSSNLQDHSSSRTFKGEFREVLGHAGIKYHRKGTTWSPNDGIWVWHWFSPSRMNCLATINVFRDVIQCNSSWTIFPSIDITWYHTYPKVQSTSIHSRPEESISQAITQFVPFC